MRHITPMHSAAPALQELLESLQQAQGDLDQAHAAFNAALDPDLVDAAIFQIRAGQSRVNYLLRQIKAAQGPDCPAAAALDGREKGAV